MAETTIDPLILLEEERRRIAQQQAPQTPLDPLLEAAASGVGKFIGAGPTNLIQGAATLATLPRVSQVDQSRLRDLERRAALGELGLSDEALASMRDVRLSPIQAAQRSGFRNLAGQMGIEDASSGGLARAAMAQQQATAEAMDPGLREIMAADQAEAARQREQMQQLEKDIEAQKDERRKAIAGGVVDLASGVVGLMGGGLAAAAAGKAVKTAAGLEQNKQQKAGLEGELGVEMKSSSAFGDFLDLLGIL